MTRGVKPRRGNSADKPAKIGRPSLMTPAIAKAICNRLSDGESLRKICQDDAMPAWRTVIRWVADDASFRQHYERAREAYADCVFDALIDLADESDPAEAAKVRLQIDARKWALGRMAPKKYGDRVALEHTGPNGGPIEQRIVIIPGNGRNDRGLPE